MILCGGLILNAGDYISVEQKAKQVMLIVLNFLEGLVIEEKQLKLHYFGLELEKKQLRKFLVKNNQKHNEKLYH